MIVLLVWGNTCTCPSRRHSVGAGQATDRRHDPYDSRPELDAAAQRRRKSRHELRDRVEGELGRRLVGVQHRPAGVRAPLHGRRSRRGHDLSVPGVCREPCRS